MGAHPGISAASSHLPEATQTGVLSQNQWGKGTARGGSYKEADGWDTVKDFSQAVVQHLAQTIPQRFVAKSGPRNRVGKIFIDYLRNGFGATTVSAWSVRARPGLGVSVPIAWEELEALTSGARWSVSNIHERLDKGNEPWGDYEAARQSISPAMKILGFKPANNICPEIFVQLHEWEDRT